MTSRVLDLVMVKFVRFILKKIQTVKIRLKNRKMVFFERVNCKKKPTNYLQTSTSICNRL
jgi:hypothetical protein